MSGTVKPRITVSGNTITRVNTGDNFQNFYANVGFGTLNPMSGSTYGFNPLSRNRTLLEWMYRGSWLVRKVIDCPAEDMTREGVNIESDMEPDAIDALTQYWTNLQIWERISDTLKWSRLYGGCLAVIMIDGQRMEDPLRIGTVSTNQFQGLLVLDRWQVYPHVESLVKTFGADFGLPEYYEVVADARSVPRMKIHHSRCIRFDGIRLPYWQKMAENEWGLSVIEPMWDRMIAFDSATSGAAQLVYKAHLRVLKLQQFRQIMAQSGGPAFQGLANMIKTIRAMQTNEGLTCIDADDDFVVNQYAFSGLSDMLIQFAQQVSGAADVPMTRMFSQSPAGMNATGESDLRNYYDGIKSAQETRLRRILKVLFDLTHRSLFGKPLPNGFNFTFKPLWQLTEESKAQIATQIATAVEGLFQTGIFTPAMALKEIRQYSRITGFGSNITDEDIEHAEQAPPPMPGMEGGEGAGGMPGGGSPLPGSAGPDVAPPTVPREPVPDQLPADDTPKRALRLLAGGKGAIGHAVGGAEQDDAAMGRARSLIPGEDITTAHVNLHTGTANLPGGVRVNFLDQQRSIIDVGGLQCVVETEKGQKRTGYGWAVNMPCHYGYIRGTSSMEGPQEQFDCYIGDDLESDNVWVIDQLVRGTDKVDEQKAMLGFSSRDEAVAAYKASFNDFGEDRIGTIRKMSVGTLKRYLEGWQYGRKQA